MSTYIHVLSNNQSLFYTYPQIIAKKGADEVMPFLYHFSMNVLNQKVKHLHIFCDSCAGQNKNFTLVRFLHFLVHKLERFDCIKVTFPERGHSYLECDKDFGLISQKSKVEIPSQWNDVFKAALQKPTPFEVLYCSQEFFFAWTNFLQKTYLQKDLSFCDQARKRTKRNQRTSTYGYNS